LRAFRAQATKLVEAMSRFSPASDAAGHRNGRRLIKENAITL
jgi:hypothetical protein